MMDVCLARGFLALPSPKSIKKTKPKNRINLKHLGRVRTESDWQVEERWRGAGRGARPKY